MATYFAQNNANINSANMWNTAANGSGTFLTWPPASGDVLVANNKTITVNVSADLGSTGQVRNDTTGGATAGGYFDLAASVTLTANFYGSGTGTQCVRCNLSAPSIAYLVGSGYGGTLASAYGAQNVGTGTLNITGPLTGGSGNANTHAANNAGTGTVTIAGALLGGATGASGAGVNNASSGTVTISSGSATGGAGGTTAYGAVNASTGILTNNGLTYGSESAVHPGLYGASSSGFTYAAGGLVSSSIGTVPIGGFVRIATGASSTWKYRDSTLTEKTMIAAEYAGEFGVPDADDVRYGVSYALGNLTGTCHVPAAASVVAGVPVDATEGTADLLTAADVRTAIGLASADLDSQLAALPTAQDVWEYTTRELTTSAGGATAQDVWEYATRSLTEAPDVPTVEEIAAEVRTELTPELSRVANCATVESTGDQLSGLL